MDSTNPSSGLAQDHAEAAQEQASTALTELEVLITMLKRMVADDPSMPIELENHHLFAVAKDTANNLISNVDKVVEIVFKELGKAFFHIKLDTDEAKGVRWGTNNEITHPRVCTLLWVRDAGV